MHKYRFQWKKTESESSSQNQYPYNHVRRSHSAPQKIKIKNITTHPVVNVTTILADPFSLPELRLSLFFGSLGSSRFLFSKDIQTGATTNTAGGSSSLLGHARMNGRGKGIGSGRKGCERTEKGQQKRSHCGLVK